MVPIRRLYQTPRQVLRRCYGSVPQPRKTPQIRVACRIRHILAPRNSMSVNQKDTNECSVTSLQTIGAKEKESGKLPAPELTL
jgi:hypothetical protein